MSRTFSLDVVKKDVREQLNISNKFYDEIALLVGVAESCPHQETKDALLEMAERLFSLNTKLVENANKTGEEASRIVSAA